jgi:hypothetical protein
MTFVALKMLLDDRAKYLGIIMGLTFASLLITQQLGIFVGLMSRPYGFVTDAGLADIWVMDPKVQFIDDIKPLPQMQLWRVRGVAGKLAKTAPDGTRVPLQIGDILEPNDHRAVVVGICRVTRTFQSQPVVYTTYTRATTCAPRERKLLSFVLVKAKPGENLHELSGRIQRATSLAAYGRAAFAQLTVDYFMKNTGIPINFGITVVLGFVVGPAIAGQTFYNFTLENLRHFGALKAMGTPNGPCCA